MNYGIAGTICLISSVATLAPGTTTPATSGANERPTLSLSHVEPYTAEFDYFLDDPGATGQRAGYWTDSLSLAEGRVVRRVERYTSEGRLDLARVVVADHETLAPVRNQQRFGPELANVYQLEFAGGE